VFSGGRRLVGWTEATVAGKKLWTVDIPEVKAGKWYFHQLWVNNQRRPRARHPNEGFINIAGVPDSKAGDNLFQGYARFRFAPGDLKNFDNLKDVDVVVLRIWIDDRLPLEGIDEKEHIATCACKSRAALTEGGRGARYYVENALELLDVPGEWYLNRQTGRLYYYPLPGEKIKEMEAFAPVLSELLHLAGKPGTKEVVENLVFRGLTFAHAEWWLPRTNPGDSQAAVSVPGAIQGNGVMNCAFENCTVAHVSNYAIDLHGGCQKNRIVGCHLFDLGAGGVKIGETGQRTSPAQHTHSNAVTDCHIHGGGRVFHQAVGLWVGQSYGNRLAHNHIHDLYYTGVSIGWTWGYGKTLARDNVLEFNHIHDLGKAWLSDMGGIYTLGTQPGTVVRNNIFHDIAGFSYGGWGIYFDEGSTGIVAENNLVYRTTHGGFHQHYGKENVVRNNIFALGRDQQLQRTRQEPHLSFTFERNLVFYRTNLLAGAWNDDKVALDYNLYWREGGPVNFGGLSLEQWQKKGRDRHSLIADPLFEAPDRADFRLKTGTPAEKIGFRPLDLSKVGPRPPQKREGS
jgi:hypothetical protein